MKKKQWESPKITDLDNKETSGGAVRIMGEGWTYHNPTSSTVTGTNAS